MHSNECALICPPPFVCQYPDMFRAASTRNPVANIASMISTSDIPGPVCLRPLPITCSMLFVCVGRLVLCRGLWRQIPIRGG